MIKVPKINKRLIGAFKLSLCHISHLMRGEKKKTRNKQQIYRTAIYIRMTWYVMNEVKPSSFLIKLSKCKWHYFTLGTAFICLIKWKMVIRSVEKCSVFLYTCYLLSESYLTVSWIPHKPVFWALRLVSFRLQIAIDIVVQVLLWVFTFNFRRCCCLLGLFYKIGWINLAKMATTSDDSVINHRLYFLISTILLS